MQSEPQAPVSEEDAATSTLAYYDSRSVPDERIRRIFCCMQSDLDSVRATDLYKTERASLEQQQTDQATATDDCWDTLERTALGNLVETMDTISDERVLLGIAVQANKAGRRRGGLSPKQQNAGMSDIPVQTAQGTTKVVRLRARFLERLTSADGSEQMMDRQVEIQTETASGDLDEVIDPRTMKALLRDKIGVDTENMHVRRHQGPDAIGGAYIDFDGL